MVSLNTVQNLILIIEFSSRIKMSELKYFMAHYLNIICQLFEEDLVFAVV